MLHDLPPSLPAVELPARCIRLGWVNRQFRCVKRKRGRGQDGGIITVITARSEAASMYTDLLTADYSTGTSITNSIQSEAPEPPTSLVASDKPQAIEFTWALGAFWTLHGITELWEHTASTPFSSATKIWEGRGTRIKIGKNDTTTRYYWVRMRTIGGQVSATEPASTGLAAAARRSTTGDIEFNAATDTGSVVVNDDLYNFPSAVGVQDRVFTEFTYTNSTPDPVTLEVSVTGVRIYTTPAGLSGTADAVSRISVRNITDSLGVASTQDWLPQQIEDQAANASGLYTESTVFTVQVPAGKQYGFQPIFRSLTNVGSTGTLTVETLGYTMRVAAIKR